MSPSRDLLLVRNYGVQFFVLREGDVLYLLDTGFIRGRRALKRALHQAGWDSLPIRGIILTHGHLDHTLNVTALSRHHQAWIAAPALDAEHYLGWPCYTGLSRVTGAAEWIGRKLLRYRPFTPDRLLNDGDWLDVWGGLQVVSLPGHTAGHCGYFARSKRLLFSGDLFASFAHGSHHPPAFLNQNSATARSSIHRALTLQPIGVWPCHADQTTSECHLERLRELV